MLFRVIKQGVVVIYYRRFGTTYRFHFQGSGLYRNVGKINYHYSLRNDAEERSCHLLRGGSLKSLVRYYLLTY